MIEDNKINIKVPFADCDPSGYIHHSKLIEYGERGRIALLADNGITIATAMTYGFVPVTYKIDARFTNPVRYDDEIVVHTNLHSVSPAKIINDQTLYVGETPVATFSITTVFFNMEGEMVPLPEGVLDGEVDHERLKRDLS